MSKFSSFGQSGDPRDLERVLVDKSTLAECVAVLSEGALAATRTIYGPFVRYGERVFDGVFLTVTSVSSPVFTLQPGVVVDGTFSDVGKAVSTSGVAFTAGKPFRCHEAAFLDKRLVAGSVLALRLTRSSGTITNPTVQFVTVGG